MNGTIKVAFDNMQNMLGSVNEDIKKRITSYLENPTYAKWDDIHTILISSNITIWQAILKIDNSFPKTGRTTDLYGNVVKEWKKIPEPELVIEAIKHVTLLQNLN